MTDWSEIMRAVREQKSAEIIRDEQKPLAFGEYIAWTDHLMGRTNAISPVHRVGYPQLGEPYTTCGELIPPPGRWFALSRALINSMGRCRFCAAEIARIARENVA